MHGVWEKVSVKLQNQKPECWLNSFVLLHTLYIAYPHIMCTTLRSITPWIPEVDGPAGGSPIKVAVLELRTRAAH
jgi:hypothetical protein